MLDSVVMIRYLAKKPAGILAGFQIVATQLAQHKILEYAHEMIFELQGALTDRAQCSLITKYGGDAIVPLVLTACIDHSQQLRPLIADQLLIAQMAIALAHDIGAGF